MGASLEDEGSFLGAIPRAVSEQTKATIIIAKAAQPEPVSLLELERAGEEERIFEEELEEVSDIVDKWFAENTFHSDEFSDLAELIALKEKQNLSISLGLPALNEEATIGQIIKIIKRKLYDEYPLLDEIVVIDGGSSDRTPQIAKELGVPVHTHYDILSSMGGYPGKGEGLWKSLFILEGDIIVWIDTDIRNIKPDFVVGLVGPLLKYPRIKYVKGFFRRPLRIGQRLLKAGGGRVTELTARPLINTFFPSLSGLVQPLSGQCGLPVIGQVDLMELIHRNRELSDLSEMSFAIVQVVMDWLEGRGKLHLFQEISKNMKLVQQDRQNLYLKPKRIEDIKRPPMITVPAYREKFKNKIFTKKEIFR